MRPPRDHERLEEVPHGGILARLAEAVDLGDQRDRGDRDQHHHHDHNPDYGERGHMRAPLNGARIRVLRPCCVEALVMAGKSLKFLSAARSAVQHGMASRTKPQRFQCLDLRAENLAIPAEVEILANSTA